MDPNGDILDEFDDADDLKKSIEAGNKGPWNDESARFVDPKIEELRKQMTRPQTLAYTERRLKDLKEQGLKSEARPKRGKKQRKDAPKADPFAPPSPAEDAPWSSPDNWESPPGAEPDAAPDPYGSRVEPATSPAALEADAIDDDEFEAPPVTPIAKPRRSIEERAEKQSSVPRTIGQYTISLFCSALVFGAVLAIVGGMTDWSIDLIYRCSAAAAFCGVTWRLLRSPRVRAAALCALAYCAAFLPQAPLDQPQYIFALFLGLLVALCGSAVLGKQDDEIE